MLVVLLPKGVVVFRKKTVACIILFTKLSLEAVRTPLFSQEHYLEEK